MKVEAVSLTRKFGAVTALDGVSFRLEPGEIAGFAGPNGAGKSTALRILAGRDLPDSGDVRYDGTSLCEYPEKLLPKIGFMPDALDGSTNTVVAEHLDLALRLRGFSGPEKRKRFAEAVEKTGIGTMLDHTVASLSKGMRQRVSLARMLASDPAVLLLDEPAEGLDPRARIELRDILRDLAKKGKTVFLSSHILTELDELCDRAIIIDRGRICDDAAARQTLQASGCALLISAKLAAETFAGLLAKKPEVAAAEPENAGRVRVELKTGDPAAFIAGLIGEGVPVIGFELIENKLETRYLDATGKDGGK